MASRSRRTRLAVLASAILAGAVVALFVVGLTLGSYAISPTALLATLTGSGDPGDRFIVLTLRLPRVVLAVLVGVAFALAGGLFQNVLGNPLASPDVIGVTGGASAAAVLAILVLGLSGASVALFAAVGALAVSAAIYFLAWRAGVHGYRFVLIGVAFAFLVEAVISYLLTRADVRDAQVALVWLVGSLSGAQWEDSALLAGGLIVLVPVLVVLAPRLRVLQLGDDTATGLGLRTTMVRTGALAVAVLLAALGTSAVGPIAFVAFASAPIARRIVGHGLALVPTALMGAALVLCADMVGQHLLPGGQQVPVGIITGAVGAPYLLWLLARAQRTGGMV